MKKIYLTLLLLIPALFASAQGPIKAWNDQLDDFITVFNQVNPTLEQLYADNGADVFGFTYFEPESGDVIMEASILDNDQYNAVNDEVMREARNIALNHLGKATAGNSRMNQIVNEFAKRNTNVVLLYSTNKGGERITKSLTLTPQQIKEAR